MPQLRLHARLFGSLIRGAIAPALAIGLIACSRADAPEPTPAFTAVEVVERSATAMRELSSFEFELSHPRGATLLPGNLALERAEGSVVSPDSYELTAEASFGRGFIKLSAVVIGEDAWITNPLTGGWLKASGGESPLTSADPAAIVAGMLSLISSPQFEGSQAGAAYVVKGVATAEILESLVGEVAAGRSVEVLLTIDRSSFLVQKARLTGGVTAEEPADPAETVREIRLSGFNHPTQIRPPI